MSGRKPARLAASEAKASQNPPAGAVQNRAGRLRDAG